MYQRKDFPWLEEILEGNKERAEGYLEGIQYMAKHMFEFNGNGFDQNVERAKGFQLAVERAVEIMEFYAELGKEDCHMGWQDLDCHIQPDVFDYIEAIEEEEKDA